MGGQSVLGNASIAAAVGHAAERGEVAAVVPLAIGPLAACGDGGSTTAADPQASVSDSPSSPSSPTGSRTPDAGSKHTAVDPADFADRLKTAAKAITTARFTMSMDLGGQTVYAKGALDMTGEKPAMPPSGSRAGDILLADSTIFTTLFGSSDSLDRFWRNLAIRV